MLGREPEFWERCLNSGILPLQLLVLQVAREHGPAALWLLQQAPHELPRWPMLHALEACLPDWRDWPAGEERELLKILGASPHLRGRNCSPAECERQIAAALTPHARLSWTLCLLRRHGENAAASLLRLLVTPRPSPAHWRALQGVAAWGLGRLGRSILPEIRDRWKSACMSTRDRLCQALWYLGPRARGCETWLRQHSGTWCEAVLYALRERGNVSLYERGAVPLYIESALLERLALDAFSPCALDRRRAAYALYGYGPNTGQVGPIYAVLARDEEEAVRRFAWTTVAALAQPVASDTLRLGLLSPESEVRRCARHCFVEQHGPPTDVWFEAIGRQDKELERLAELALEERPAGVVVLRQLKHFDEKCLEQALTYLRTVDDLTVTPELEALLQHPRAFVRRAALELVASAGRAFPLLLPLLNDPEEPEIRDRALHVLMDRADSDGLAELLRRQSGAVIAILDERLSRGKELTWKLSPALRKTLEDLCQNTDSRIATAALRVLRCLGPVGGKWSEALRERGRRDSAAHLMRVDPEDLLQSMRAGKLITPDSLHAVVDSFKGERLTQFLKHCFVNCTREDRGFFESPLQRLRAEGWQMLRELVGHEDREVAEDAVELLGKWLQASGALYQLWQEEPALLRVPRHDPVRTRLAELLASYLLQPPAPVEPWILAWALALGESPSPEVAARAVASLGRFRRLEPDEVKEALLRHLKSPFAPVQEAAAALLREWL